MRFLQSLGMGLLLVAGSLALLNIEFRTPSPRAQIQQHAISPSGSATNITLNQVAFSFDQFEQTLVNSIEKNKRSVVSIVASKDIQFIRGGFFSEPELFTQRRQVGGGSGIIVTKDGYIITNKHVVDDGDAIYSVLFHDGTSAETENVRLDPLLDIAVIKIAASSIPEDTTPATILGLQEPVQIGQFTYAIGNTLAEFQNSVTFGIISGKNRELNVDERSVYVGLYQTDTPISMGNSGGPLFNVNGKVIGVNTAVSALGENIGFALPITQEFVDATLNQIRKTDAITRPFLGIRSRVLNKGLAQELGTSFSQGMYILEVIAGSPADEAGLQAGDVLLQINGRDISETAPLLYQLYTYEPGETITLTLGRAGQESDVDLLLSKL